MAVIISIFNGKGGVGKTTTSICLYEAFKREGLFDLTPMVALVDADVQKSVINLVKVMELPVKAYALSEVRNQIDRLGDIVIIDNPPYLRATAIRQLPKSNIIILPCDPSPTSALGLLQTINALKEFRLLKLCYVLFTMVRPNNSYVEEIKVQIASYGVPVLETQLGHRIAYNKALASGSLYAQRDQKAIQEIENLSTEILNIVME